MKRVALDTSVVVAALLAVHERHHAASATVGRALHSEGGAVLPVPVALAAYAVLTRMPPPWRLRADAAERALRETYAQRATLIGLQDAGEARQLVGDLAREGLVGGIAHDAHVVACARAGGATALATLNRRDLARLGLGGMTLIVP